MNDPISGSISSKASLSTSSDSGNSNTEEVGCVRREYGICKISCDELCLEYGRAAQFLTGGGGVFDNCSLMEP